jgi:hypothetical protein
MTWLTRPTRLLGLVTLDGPEPVALVAVLRLRGLVSAAVAMFSILAFVFR